jgi:hypothetical protein
MIWGVHVGICLLAAMALMEFLKSATRSIGSQRLRAAVSGLVALAVVAFCAVGSGYLVRAQLERNRAALFGDYIPTAHLEAMQWLKENRDGAETVLTTPTLSALLPGRSGMTVFGGHWAQTLDAEGKARFTDGLLRETPPPKKDRVEQVFERNRVRFVLVGTEGDPRGLVRRRLATWPILVEVFRNDSVTIWEYSGYRKSSPTRSWPDGDWQGPPYTKQKHPRR